MTSATPRCDHCGATVARREARFCDYCGTELPRPEPAPAPSSPFGDVAARFAALEAHPDFPELLRRDPPGHGRVAAQAGCNALLLGIFVSAGVAVAVVFATFFPPLALIPLAIVAIGVLSLLGALHKSGGSLVAPLERVPALVVGERTKLSGGGDHAATRTQYFVTLETVAGERRELDASDDLAGALTPGDLGVAFVKGAYLLDFARVRV